MTEKCRHYSELYFGEVLWPLGLSAITASKIDTISFRTIYAINIANAHKLRTKCLKNNQTCFVVGVSIGQLSH